MRALQTKVPVPVQAHPRKSAVGNCSTCQRLRPYCSHVVDNCSTCQRHCVNGCDWRAGLCERLRTTSCIHELAVQDAMHSASIAKRVLSAIACIAASTCRSAAASNIVHASACHACKDMATQHSSLEPRLFFVGLHSGGVSSSVSSCLSPRSLLVTALQLKEILHASKGR